RGPAPDPLTHMLRESLDASPVFFGTNLMYLLEVADVMDLPFAGPARTLADIFLEVDTIETTSALHVVASTTADELQRARIEKVLAARSHEVHPVVRDFGRVEVVEALHASHALSDGSHIALMLRWPDGTEAAAIVMILGGPDGRHIGDVILSEDDHAVTRATLRQAADELTVIDTLNLGHAADTLAAAAIGYLDLAEDARPQTESWPALNSFLSYLVRAMFAQNEASPAGEPMTHTPSPFAFWQNTPIEVPAAPAKPTLARLRIEIEETEPLVWREVEVRSDLNLAALHDVIVAAFGWLDYHLHRFWPDTDRYGSHFVTEFDEEESAVGTREETVRIDQVLREAGDQVAYEYDFGDSWRHLITLLSTRPLQSDDPQAVCVGGERRGPVEDVGGTGGHNELVADFTRVGLAGLEKDLQSWLPEGYDPAEFDVETANRELAESRKSPLSHLCPVRLCDGLADLRRRTREGFEDLHDLITALVEADLPQLEDVTEEQAREEFAHLYAMLELVADRPVTLTQAGYLKPAVVATLVESLDVHRDWLWGSSRESDVVPVLCLREGMTEIGLLRKARGRLSITAAGRKALADPAALLSHVASRIGHSRRPFDLEARAAYLLLVGVGDRGPGGERVVPLLAQGGWRYDDGAPISTMALWRATDHTRALLGELFGGRRSREGADFSPSVRAIARGAVLPRRHGAR
ncbi:MAG: plasmid pRiA4b ORF-3 family protein, partial [Actinomycetia bacterium]|nr:plasmid pRiA4b ORF-3 family protein [Actinomycetes bacterium]